MLIHIFICVYIFVSVCVLVFLIPMYICVYLLPVLYVIALCICLFVNVSVCLLVPSRWGEGGPPAGGPEVPARLGEQQRRPQHRQHPEHALFQ